jgi:hypothetical protein
MSLRALQENFQAWLTSESAEAAAQFSERAPPGLAIYLNNYRAQLLACLSATYPVVRAWIGDVSFEAAAAKHIDAVAPHAWTLDAYGLDFPETLATLHPSDPEIAELARLECELGLAFVGQDSAPFDPAALADIDWDAAVIQFVPSFTQLPVTTNVGAIWSAINANETPPPAVRLPKPASLAIWRDGFAPRFRTVAAEEATFLEQVCEGLTFGAICAALVERLGEERAAAAAGAFLSQWLADHLIAHIRC